MTPKVPTDRTETSPAPIGPDRLLSLEQRTDYTGASEQLTHRLVEARDLSTTGLSFDKFRSDGGSGTLG